MKKYLARGGLFGVYLSLASPAFAYLDGATGSMILQAAIGGIATAMFYGRLYSSKIKNFFKQNILRSQSNGEPE